MSETTHAEFIQGLRELAEFFESHPEIPVPYSKSISICQLEKEQIVQFAKIFGKSKKTYADDYFWITKEFSGGVELTCFADRKEVCVPVQVGTRIEPAYFKPAEHIPEREVPILEWRCDPILAPTPEEVEVGAPGQAEAEKLLDPVADFLRPNPVADVVFEEEEKPGDERVPDFPL